MLIFYRKNMCSRMRALLALAVKHPPEVKTLVVEEADSG